MKLNVIGVENEVVTVNVFGPVPGAVIARGPLNGMSKDCFGDAISNSLKSMAPVALLPEAEVSFRWPTKSTSPETTPVQTMAKSPASEAGVMGPGVWAKKEPSL